MGLPLQLLSELLLDDSEVMLPRDRESPDGDVDMYDAALSDPDPGTALARLRGHRFVAGALRSWTDSEQVAHVALHRFGTSRDADLAAAEQAHGLIAGAARPFAVDLGPPVSFGASIADPHALEVPFIAHVVVRPIGTTMMLVLLGGGRTRPSDAVRLAVAQSRRLMVDSFGD